MGRREKINKLYKRLKQSQNNVSFTDICTLAEMAGLTFDRQNGTSHRIYRHEKHPKIMNFQAVHGKAKPYQVNQLINFIDEHKLLNEEAQDV